MEFWILSVLSGMIILVTLACLFVSWKARKELRQVSLSSTISNMITYLRELEFEEEIIINENGEIILRTTQYDPEFVGQTDEQVAMFKKHGNLTSIHNHVDDTPLSLQDLYYAARADFLQTIVVTPHYVYLVCRPETGWKTESELNAAVNHHQALLHMEVVGESEFPEPDGAITVATDYKVLTTDQALAAICQDLGYQIVKTRD